MRPTIIAGNWKMYKTAEEASAFVTALSPHAQKCAGRVLLAVPFTAIQAASKATAEGGRVEIGAQNMNDATEGAFTGEIAAKMLKEAGATFVILGHSERRHLFSENNAFINRKVRRALAEGIEPILCIGETLQEREEGQMESVLTQQLKESLADVTAEEMGKVVIAYEPVWAIGTGKTATEEQAQEAHRFCRELAKELWGEEVSEKLPILYGGSVKPDNVALLAQQPDIDGVLVGGASLSLESFAKIVDDSDASID